MARDKLGPKEFVSIHVQFVFPGSLDLATKNTCDSCGKYTYCVEIRIEGDPNCLYNCGLCLLNFRKKLERLDQGRFLLYPEMYRQLDKAIRKVSKVGRDRIIN
jgi:hypothetical protein